MPRHKHADAIIAWANGEEIQYFWGFQWRDWEETSCPGFAGTAEWRIKPKRIKKEGWVNVYRIDSPDFVALVGGAFETKEKAEEHKSGEPVACIRIEWEEEE